MISQKFRETKAKEYNMSVYEMLKFKKYCVCEYNDKGENINERKKPVFTTDIKKETI